MKLITLLDKMNEGYPDGFLSEYYHWATGSPITGPFGDGLAEFIVKEIGGTFVPDASDKDQKDVAVHALQRAQWEIQGCIDKILWDL